jgi:flagellar biosynthesis protein FlhA
MGTAVAAQLGGHKRALQIAAGAALALCLVPGLPKLPFLLIGLVVLYASSRVTDQTHHDEAEVIDLDHPPAVSRDSPEAILSDLSVDPLELALAADLIDMVEGPAADLLDRVRSLRRKLALELGVVMPPVRTRDNVDLPLSIYSVLVNGVEVARGQAPAGCVLAIGDGLEGLPGRAAREPVFGLDGKWIAVALRGQAELLGATVVDRSAVIITHLAEIVRSHASRLLGREEVAALTQSVKKTHPVVVEDLTPALLSLGEIQRILHALLDEGAPIRDLVRIYEALSVCAKTSTDPDKLLEAARAAIGPAIAAQYVVDGRLDVLTIDPRMQQTLAESVRPAEGGLQLLVNAGLAEALVTDVQKQYQALIDQAAKPVLVCPSQLRLPLRRLTRIAVPDLPVLSFGEITGGNARIESVGVINDVRDSVR